MISFLTVRKRLLAARTKNPLLFWLRIITVVAVIVLFAIRRTFWTPDTLFIVLLAVFIVFGQARAFLLRFAPFLLILLAYDSFRGIADDLNHNVHFYEMISFDRAVFGVLPTVTLQQWWWHGSLQWYDFYLYFLYTLHFAVPVVLGLVIWKTRDKLFWPFAVAIIGVSFMAYITYVIFPAAPPWMAAEMGIIEPIHKISTDIWFAMGIQNASEVYANLSPNLVAAVPSLHSAYPMLVMLFVAKVFGWRRTWWLLFYPLSVWVGVVYLGEHYVIDALLGAVYAAVAYAASLRFFAWRAKRPSRFRQQYQRGHAKGMAYAYHIQGKQ